ncbi:hypothetical protein [Halogranum rubrum]|uniref:hypothetical protein n=1 Tax=Halogranum rubrum TaxID=553466 RepID=UPI0031833572
MIGGLGWVVFGAVGVGGVGAATEAGMSDSASVSAGLGIVAVTVGRAVEAGSYFVDREYESVSAQEPLRSALVAVAGIGSALFVGGGFVLAGAPGPLVLVAVFTVKFLADVVDVYRERLESFDERTSADFGLATESSHWEPIDTTFDDSPETVRPKRSALLVDGLLRGVRSPAALLVATPLVLLGLLAVTNSGGTPSVFFVPTAILFGTFAVFGVFDRLYRYLCMEYRIAGDAVGYDRLLGPQWRLSRERLASAERTRTVTDRLFGTETLLVDVDDRTRRLPHLSSRAVAHVLGYP